MVTFWDLSVTERAKLTEDEVKSFCKVQLMQKGIQDPLSFPEVVVPERPPIKTETWFQAAGLLFRNQEDASEVLSRAHHRETYDSRVGYAMKYAEPIESEVKIVALFIRDEIMGNRNALAEVNSKKEEQRRRQDAYDSAMKECREAVADIWNEYYASIERDKFLSKIRATFEEYKTMCDGNDELALSFLSKTYPEPGDIDEALKEEEIN